LLFNNLFHSFSKQPYKDVLFVSEGVDWVTTQEIKGVAEAVETLGIKSRFSGPLKIGLPRQSIFYPSAYFLRYPSRYLTMGGRIAFPFYHGYPEYGDPLVLKCHENLRKYHRTVTRIQASHSYMRSIILESGINPEKVFLIPIAIDGRLFSPQTSESKKNSRNKFGIPQSAVVAGSFQKDGNGWGEGLEPKLVKGPDIFIDAVKKLKESVPELYVLLSGPARGYVKKGLERAGIPYKHIYLEKYEEIGALFQCLDLYIIASRQEGGPKAVLESMASGVPLVTTRVGQAMDLVEQGGNAFMVDIEDSDGLSECSRKVLSDTELRSRMVDQGIRTARENTYSSHIPLWKNFFKGFVNADQTYE